jgi:tetratricopeptide (TPR) repeat protein
MINKLIAFTIFLLVITLSNASASPALLYNNRKPTEYFVNHQNQILELRNKLLKNHTVGITGITGKGKSEMAREYVSKYHDNYEIIACLNVDVDLVPQYINLAKDINRVICLKEGCLLSTSPKDVKRDIMSFLAHKTKWLLIFDNVQLNQNNKIEDIINWEHNGHIIITSQDTKFMPNIVKTPYLNNEDATSLVKKILPNIPDTIIQQIVDKCQGYPYLINRISTFISNYKHKTVQEVISFIEKDNNPVKSFTDLLLQSINPTSKELLQKIALLNNQGVSRNILNHISSNKNTLADDIHELVMLGALEQISEDINNQVFQVHDVLNKEILRKFPKKLHQKNINDIVDAIIGMLPENDKTRGYVIISEDETMISNLEKVLINSDYYSGDIHKSIELRTHVLDYYIDIRDPVNCSKLVDWMNHKQSLLGKINDKQKDMYAYNLTKMGYYEEFANSNYKKAIDYYKKALNIATANQPITRLIANWQLASAQISLGDLNNASKSIEAAILGQDPEVIKDNRIWHLQARILLAQGNYNKALNLVNDGLEIYFKAGDKNSGTSFYTHLFKVEILNYMGAYKEAYNIVKDINLMSKEHIVNRNLLENKILVQLARAELGLSMHDKALEHSELAVKNLMAEEGEEFIVESINRDLANAYAVYGDALMKTDKYQEAIKNYDKAEHIYYNRYRNNTKNVDEVSYVLAQGSKASCYIKSKEWYNKFFNSLLRYFTKEHFRVQEVQDFCQRTQMEI